MAVLLCADRFLEPLRSLHRIIDEFGEKLALIELGNGGINVKKQNTPQLVQSLPVESDEFEFVTWRHQCP